MFGLLMFFFILLCLFLAIFILIQQGKGDMGLGSLGGSTQMLFGGSGGQSFFEKTTWFLGAVFMLGALGLAVLKSKEIRQSRLEGFSIDKKIESVKKDASSNAKPDVASDSDKLD
jgi:preprotein translocase subunit SecG